MGGERRRKSVRIVAGGTPLPPPPPGVRYVRVPRCRIVIADDDLRDRAEQFFHWPMILLALGILPLFAIEFIQQPEGWLRLAVDVGFAIIWIAFVVEFAIKVSIAESRFEYCKRNWIDIVIIVLPVLRVFRVARLARTTRVVRLRGVGMKLARYALTMILGLSATERLLERFGLKLGRQRKDPRKMTRFELVDEVKKRRKQVDAWEAWYAARQEYAAECERDRLPPGPVVRNAAEDREEASSGAASASQEGDGPLSEAPELPPAGAAQEAQRPA